MLRIKKPARWREGLPVVVVLGAVGVALVAYISGAGSPIVFEAESGVLSGPAARLAFTGSSGSGAVKFSAAASPSPTATPAPATAYARGLAWYQANTGVPAGTTLSPVSGPIDIRTAGTVIDGKTISGDIYVYASNVIIRNSKIYGLIHINAGSNLLLDHIEMDGSNVPDRETYSAITYGGYTLRYSKIHDYAQDSYMSDDTTIEDSWLYGLRSSGQHAEPIISMHGTNMSIQRNWLDSTWTNAKYYVSSALSLYAQDGPITNTIVDGNYLMGSGYLMYLGGRVGDLNNVQVTNNTFGVCNPAIECYGPLAPTIVDGVTASKWSNNKISNGTVVAAPPVY